jgi:FkbM family methyltransferase
MSKLKEYLKDPLAVEPYLLRFFSRNDNLVIFDIGACEGEDSIRYSKLFPQSKIYSFEPLLENYNKAKISISSFGDDRIQLFQLALSHKNGTAEFFVSSGHPEGATNTDEWNYGNKSSSLLPPGEVTKVFKWLDFKEVRNVETKKLFDFMNDHQIEVIDYIHMDVQGAELSVLKGAESKLENIKSIWLEVESRPLYKDQPLKNDIENFLVDKGFVKVFEEVNSTAGDQLYVNAKYFSDLKYSNLNQMNSNSDSSVKKLVKKMKNLFTNERKSYVMDSFSQSGEDVIISYIFRTIGILNPSYIDIGAHHPYRFSNTAIFYESGSCGINVEPDPDLFQQISSIRKNDINLNIGIGHKEDSLEFYKLSVPALNTFVKEEAERLAAKFGYSIVEVLEIPVKKLDTIINKHANGIFPDLLTIDVEGADEFIISEINPKNGPIVICAETISFEEDGSGVKNMEIIKMLESKGYMLYADTYINSIFVKKDKWMKK